MVGALQRKNVYSLVLKAIPRAVEEVLTSLDVSEFLGSIFTLLESFVFSFHKDNNLSNANIFLNGLFI